MLHYAIKNEVGVPSSRYHLRLRQAALALLDSDSKACRIIEADLVTNREIRVIPVAECIEALAGLVTPEEIAELQRKYSPSQ